MYNRFIHEKQQSKLNKYLNSSQSQQKLESYRKSSNKRMGQKYKERIRDFLVKITSKPIELGQYQPPVMNIIRNPESDKIIANAQMYINGFKTNKQRVANKEEENKILDLSPTKSTALLHEYRQRDVKSQIQPGMKFAGKTISETKLPPIETRQTKLRFKAIEQMGNNIKSMRLNMIDEIGLINKLQTVSGGKQLDHLTFSMIALRESKMLKVKHNKTK